VNEVFRNYARYYDLLYRDKDYAAEARYVDGLIQRHAAGATDIMDLGCGTGVHAIEFAKLGYKVHGIDSSDDMLQRAQSRQSQLQPELAARLNFSPGDICTYRAGHQFGVVTALFHVVSYQVSDEDLAQVFATAAKHLAPGGLFLFDCWYGPAVLSTLPAVRIKRFEDTTTRILRIAEPTMQVNENVTEVDYQVMITDIESGQMKEIRERHRLRYLFLPEILLKLQNVGLSCVLQEEWRSGAQLSSATWSAVFLARASEKKEGI